MIAFKTVKYYYQAEFAIREVGRFAQQLGCHAFIVGGHTALDVAQYALTESLTGSSIAYTVRIAEGFPCLSAITTLTAEFCSGKADFIIGVGGGKAMDLAKGVAHETGARLMLIPTSAAQCACFADLIVLYNENGDPHSKSWYLKTPVDVVIADTDIIARKCPVRMFSAGIADSMAKLPEIEYTHRKFAAEWDRNSIAQYAHQIVRDTDRLYRTHGVQACTDVAAGRLTRAVEDIVTANFMLTGITSALADGCRNVALPHNIYYALCKTEKAVQKLFLHGEIVSAGITAQMFFNGVDDAYVEETRRVLNEIGGYASPAELGLDVGGGFVDELMETCMARMPYFTPEEQESARAAMRRDWCNTKRT